MKRYRRLWSLLLVCCMLLMQLPAAALEAQGGEFLSLDWDSETSLNVWEMEASGNTVKVPTESGKAVFNKRFKVLFLENAVVGEIYGTHDLTVVLAGSSQCKGIVLGSDEYDCKLNILGDGSLKVSPGADESNAYIEAGYVNISGPTVEGVDCAVMANFYSDRTKTTISISDARVSLRGDGIGLLSHCGIQIQSSEVDLCDETGAGLKEDNRSIWAQGFIGITDSIMKIEGRGYSGIELSSMARAAGIADGSIAITDSTVSIMPRAGAERYQGIVNDIDTPGASIKISNSDVTVGGSLDAKVTCRGTIDIQRGTLTQGRRNSWTDEEGLGWQDLVSGGTSAVVIESDESQPLSRDDVPFRFPSGGTTHTGYFDYDERWFQRSAYQFQPELALASLPLAMSAFNAGDGYENGPENVKNLMSELGLQEITVNDDYCKAPQRNTMGVAIGHRSVQLGGERSTLIVMALRGGGYESEWAGNFNVGSQSEYHAGFKLASDEAMRCLGQYIQENDLSGKGAIKLWLTGYSRSSAAANITAYRLSRGEKAGGVQILPKNIFAYGFATPMGVINAPKSSSYNHIFSIVNPADLVPKVAMKNWDFGRAGVTVFLPDSGNFAFAEWLEEAEQVAREYGNILGNTAEENPVSESMGQGRTYERAVNSLADHFKSPYVYEKTCQGALMDAAEKILGKASQDSDGKVLVENLFTTVPAMATWIYDEPFEFAMLLRHAGNIMPAHYPEWYLAWIRTLNAQGKLTAGGNSRTRYLTVDCPVDVVVKDTSGTEVARFTDGQSVSLGGNGIPAYVDECGSMVVELPVNRDFTVSFTGTGEGELYYNVYEVSLDGGTPERQISYQALPLEKGTEYFAVIENLEELVDWEAVNGALFDPAEPDSLPGGTECALSYSDALNNTHGTYPLYSGTAADEGKKLTPSQDLTGKEKVEAARHTVTLKTEGYGTAGGAGTFEDGAFTRLKATPEYGSTFAGWYDEAGALLSAEAELRLAVTADRVLTARFEGGSKPDEGTDTPVYTPTYSVAVAAAQGGTVTVSRTWAGQGDTVTVTVRADEGYELEKLTVTGKDGRALQCADAGAGRYTFAMPDTGVTVSAAFKESRENPDSSFTDVAEGDYYYDAVQWAVEKGITTGVSAELFGPELSCTRAQAVTFLWRSAGSPEPAGTVNPFADVSESSYCYKAVLWAVEQGITMGTGTETFTPDAIVTRAQAMTFLWRAAGQPVVNYAMPFTDVELSGYYAEAVRWAASEGIAEGTGAETFSPEQQCTRGQIVAFLWRCLAR